MILQYFGAASIAIHTKKNTKILCDPWYETPAFLGSWVSFPKIQFDYKKKYDFIYISHIHSDHFDVETLSKFDLNTKILIYKFDNPFLIKKIKQLGFKNIIQLEHGQEFFVDNDTRIKIYGPVEKDSDAKQQVIDTSLVVYDNEHTILNFNDNIYELKDKTLQQIKKEHCKIDLLCHGYTSASSYPQCTISLDEKQMSSEKERVRKVCYERSIKLINYLNPKNIMPFAGYYVLCGKNHYLNDLKANDSPFEAKKYYQQNYPNILKNRECVVLDVEESYDLITNTYSKIYEPPSEDTLRAFIEANKNIKYPYESMVEQLPELQVFTEMIKKSYNRMEIHRKKMKFSSDTKLFIDLPENKKLLLTLNGNGYIILDNDQFDSNTLDNFILMSLDFRLLYLLLKGPRFAHWDNADHGSHIQYYKKPNIYEKGIYHLICYFHS